MSKIDVSNIKFSNDFCFADSNPDCKEQMDSNGTAVTDEEDQGTHDVKPILLKELYDNEMIYNVKSIDGVVVSYFLQ